MSENFFFILSQTLGFFVKLDNFLLLLALFGLLLSWKYHKIGKILLIISMSSLFSLTLLPIGTFLLAPLENRFPYPKKLPNEIGGIIVLGGMEEITSSAIQGRPQFNGAAERIMVVPKLLKKYPNSKLVITSGSYPNFNPNIKGGHIIKQWIKPLAPKSSTIYIEDKSRNTRQNALYSQQFKENNLPWLLITSASHMPRSMGVFRKLDWNVIPYPVDYQHYPLSINPHFSQNISQLRRAGHEWVGLLAYYLNGYTDTLFPSPHKSQH
jgi:uncharacterized SAM-binding protein YcdF (DUF218 family)